MFNKYFELIKNIFENIFSHSGDVSIKSYIALILFSLSLVLITLFILVMIYGMIKIPAVLYGKILTKIKEKQSQIYKDYMSELDAEKIKEKAKSLEMVKKKIRNRKVYFVISLISFYIVIGIPTLLFVLDFTINMF